VYAQWEKLVCPLFDLPGVSNQLMFPDWMYVMDEGFGALVAGQILATCYHSTQAIQQQKG